MVKNDFTSTQITGRHFFVADCLSIPIPALEWFHQLQKQSSGRESVTHDREKEETRQDQGATEAEGTGRESSEGEGLEVKVHICLLLDSHVLFIWYKLDIYKIHGESFLVSLMSAYVLMLYIFMCMLCRKKKSKW